MEDGQVMEYVSFKIVGPQGNSVTINDFAGAGFRLLSEDDAVVVRLSDEEGNGGCKWRYGHDLTTAGKIDNPGLQSIAHLW